MQLHLPTQAPLYVPGLIRPKEPLAALGGAMLHRGGLIGGAGTGTPGGGGGGPADPYWSDVLAQWDFTTNSGGNQKGNSAYDLSAVGSAAIGSGVADFPGTSSDYLQTSTGDVSAILPSGNFAIEFWGVDFDNLTYSADKVLLSVFNNTSNERSLIIRSRTSGGFEVVVYQSGTSTPVTTRAVTLSLATNTPYYLGLFRVSNTLYSYAGSLGTFTGPNNAGALTYGPFAAVEPLRLGGMAFVTQPFDGQMQAVRITNSARGNTGGSWTPDSLPLPTS